MLQSLHIRDLALIEVAEVRFDKGLNVLSGETGGGKSLVVTALKLLRGEKASGSAVRHGAPELRVDGEFLLGSGERSRAVGAQLAELCGVEIDRERDGAELLITRIVDPAGRSKARINGRPVTLSALREVCSFLLEIHGQGDARALMRPEIQCETLDAFAGTGRLRVEFADRLTAARAARRRLEQRVGTEQERLAKVEFLRFQLGEIEAVGLVPGELDELEEEHRVLSNLDAMRAHLEGALAALADDEPSASDLLARAGRDLRAAAEIDRRLAEPADLCGEALVQIAEATRVLQSRADALDLDPGRLAAVEDRLAEVRRALSRFGPTEVLLFERLAAIESELAELEELDGRADALERELGEAVAELQSLGSKLSRARLEAAPAFARAIEGELQSLAMPDTRLEVRFDDAPDDGELLDRATAHGPGALDFRVRVNAGEPFRSMRETASGGETARIVLALKKCLADQDRVPFLVLDEIDAEIGGRLGLEVGRKLEEVARHHQLLIVTHLPQVAAFADAHFKVSKEVRSRRTHTVIAHLDRAAAERELAAMAVGEGADAFSLAEARRLVLNARKGPRRASRSAE